MNWKEFKAKGGSITVVLIGLTIAAAIIYYGLKADTINKVVGFALLAISTFFFFVGSDLFGAKKSAVNNKWQGDYWLWVLVVVTTCILGLCTLFVW
jgi:hypothetical protein